MGLDLGGGFGRHHGSPFRGRRLFGYTMGLEEETDMLLDRSFDIVSRYSIYASPAYILLRLDPKRHHYVIFQKRVRVFHRGFQTREN